jgi:hypothetical protein
MADFFKGLAGGFGTGLQLSQAVRERNMRDALAQEAGKYGVTEGAYGPGLQENIQQLQGLREQDPAQAPAYDQAIAELTRRQGLTAPDYSVASGPQSYGTRQEARQAAAPMRTEGLAGVYRQAGDVAQADALEARAFDQQRGIAREARDVAREGRDVAREGRDVQAFDTQKAAAEQQGLLTGARLTDVQRTQNLQAALDTRLADINKQEFKKPEMRTQAILSLVEELQGPQAAAQLRANYSQQELNDISLQSKKFEEGYRQSRAKGVTSALEWFDEQNTSFKLERDPKNPFRVIQVNQDGSRQLFADAKNERELGMIVDAKAKPGGWLELAKYDLDQKKADAAIAKDQALAGLYNQGGAGAGKGTLKQKVADFKEVYGRDPTEAEKSVLAGLTNKPREVSNADINARAKLMIDGGMMDPDDPTKPLSPQRAVQMATAELSGVPFVSPVDQLILDMAAARNPKAATSPAAGAPTTTPAAAPAPRGPASLGPDPNRPQSGVSPVTGLSRETPVQAPNLISAVGRGLDAGQERYKAYLETKIANRQPLTADERIRAQRFGLQ